MSFSRNLVKIIQKTTDTRLMTLLNIFSKLAENEKITVILFGYWMVYSNTVQLPNRITVILQLSYLVIENEVCTVNLFGYCTPQLSHRTELSCVHCIYEYFVNIAAHHHTTSHELFFKTFSA